uniref:Uncharacterized protein n=1 Tax=Rhizophora mucronata TaxID=61149 RepID=A0A2P2MZY1_RHIMU
MLNCCWDPKLIETP